ncbi:MAG: DEAD/DEAH box helicase [Candidatus Omnitrophica bacterium]|nr:DEAD/DEAH box helicase [Candidatus Omnitrophota bacterium]
MKFKVPTPIQHQTIPLAIQHKDIIGIAQTGTGKTHSFAIPMVQRLSQSAGKGLVLAPTRELALQIGEAFKKLAQPFKMHTACLIGGVAISGQVQALRKEPRVVIATPGRLIDHVWQGTLSVDDVVLLVLDEADRMLDMGFAQQIDQIFQFLTGKRQTLLFSATMPQEILQIASKHMKLPVCVEIAPSGTTVENVTQEVFIVKKEAKIKLLHKLLEQYRGAVLLFVRTKHGARKITRAIRALKYNAAEMHSDRSLNQRRAALEGFKSGKYKVLVATDVAARGIDVTGIELVINYDLPQDGKDYVHRIGRTARAGRSGHAISFATPDQKRDIQDIEKIVRVTLPISRHADIRAESFIESPRRTSGRRNRKSRYGGFKKRKPPII